MWIGQPSEDKMESKQTDALKQELGSQSEAVPEQELDGVVAQRVTFTASLLMHFVSQLSAM